MLERAGEKPEPAFASVSLTLKPPRLIFVENDGALRRVAFPEDVTLVQILRVIENYGKGDLPRYELPVYPITDREVQVITLVTKGLKNKEIAIALNIAHRTAQAHVRNIFKKLDVGTRTEAAMKWSRRLVGVDKGLGEKH